MHSLPVPASEMRLHLLPGPPSVLPFIFPFVFLEGEILFHFTPCLPSPLSNAFKGQASGTYCWSLLKAFKGKTGVTFKTKDFIKIK